MTKAAFDLSHGDFRQDAPYRLPDRPGDAPSNIDGVRIRPLIPNADDRGRLVELMTHRVEPGFEIVQLYQVFAEPGSVRAWLYHRKQWDRLSFTDGTFRVVLFDLRDGSPTEGASDVLTVGQGNPVQLHIPPFVVHGVQNAGERVASFINMPTEVYNPDDPDKARLSPDDPRLPYRFT